MSRYLLDTDTFTHFLRQYPVVVAAVVARLPTDLAVSIITVEEIWDGWQAAIHKAKTPSQVAAGYTRLTETMNELHHWAIVPFLETAVQLYADLRKQNLNVDANDLRIATIALDRGATVITGNIRDFRSVHGLQIEDWTAPL